MPGSRQLPRHDLPGGHLADCQICGSDGLELILDLGHQPPCDSLLTHEQLNREERSYPLRFVRCRECGLAQIDYVVAPEVLFHPDYPYRSGITQTLVQNLQATTHAIVDRFKLAPGQLAVDIGSNDGTLLKGFSSRGLRVLGIEATNIARIAIADGIETIQSFFDESIAGCIVSRYGQAAAITATNMFAHVAAMGELMRGVDHLLRHDGVFVTESHYLLDLLETVQYDSIYHEHLKFYSLRTLIRFFDYYDFVLIDAERIPNYAGSIRVYAARKSGPLAQSTDRLRNLIQAEDTRALHTAAPFRDFERKVRNAKLDLVGRLVELNRAGAMVPGIGCPGRSSTLLNYCGIDTDLVPYIAEQNSSLKVGLFLPGKHIPIEDERRLFEEQPEYALMLSWHYAKPIVANLRARGLKSKIIVPLPMVAILD
jgi:hypothetical protein